MKRSAFTMEEINVGDEILFNDAYPVQHNLFWRVINKISGNKLVVEIREMGYAEKFMISVKDVINLKKSSFAY